MVKINPLNVVKLLYDEISSSSNKSTPVNAKEIELKDHLKEIIQSCQESLDYYIETDQSLQIEESEEDEVPFQTLDEFESDDSDESTVSSSQTGNGSSSLQKKPRKMIPFEDKKKAVEYWKSGKTRNLNLSTVSKRYRFVTSVRQLYKWEKQILTGGSRNDKLQEIWLYTFMEFKKAKDNKFIVHDSDLKRWAMKKKIEINLESFTASSSWLWRFKNHYNIVSRKITKFVSDYYSKTKVDIIGNADLFISSAKLFLRNFTDDNTYNTDQSGFNKEIHSGRTLEIRGAHHVEATVQSIAATTHSYTIQPTISKSGKLLSPLFIILQEPNEKFGPRVEISLFSAPNIFVTTSSSGKITKDLLQMWFQKVFFPHVSSNSALLVDSLTHYKDEDMINISTPHDKALEILKIPPKTTSMVQPLDKYFFRMWKNFVRKFSDRVIIDGITINLGQRNNILKLQSIVHNQFSSPRFQNLLKYSWITCGYTDSHPGFFENSVEFCFNVDHKLCSKLDLECYSVSFLKCSWCKESFCFKHFFTDFHFCENFIQ